jgi:hypothetical protein
MKSEDPVRAGSFRSNQLPASYLHPQAASNGDPSELLKLELENARLLHLVAELLAKNQQLREMYCGPRQDAECAESSSMKTYPVGIWRIAAEPIE